MDLPLPQVSHSPRSACTTLTNRQNLKLATNMLALRGSFHAILMLSSTVLCNINAPKKCNEAASYQMAWRLNHPRPSTQPTWEI